MNETTERITIKELSSKGDTKKSWNPNVPEEVEDARNSFNALKKKGYTAFRIKDGGRAGRMDEFDGSAGEILMVPQYKGG